MFLILASLQFFTFAWSFNSTSASIFDRISASCILSTYFYSYSLRVFSVSSSFAKYINQSSSFEEVVRALEIDNGWFVSAEDASVQKVMALPLSASYFVITVCWPLQSVSSSFQLLVSSSSLSVSTVFNALFFGVTESYLVLGFV